MRIINILVDTLYLQTIGLSERTRIQRDFFNYLMEA